jgi:hypothetical protein
MPVGTGKVRLSAGKMSLLIAPALFGARDVDDEI